jgi:N-dimethylarginine dimethylaminohydrolase
LTAGADILTAHSAVEGLRRLRFGVLAVVFAFLLILLPARDAAAEDDADAAAVLSDTTGKLDEVVLQYSSSLAAEVLPTYRSFLKQLCRTTVVHVVCETDAQVDAFRQMLEGWRIENMERFKLINADKQITVWARDRFVVKATKDNQRKRLVVLPCLPQSDGEDRLNDKQVPALIAKCTGEAIETRESSLFFEGGNIVTSDGFLFTGHSTLTDSRFSSDEDAIRQLEKEFGKKIVVIGSDEVREPEEHIDMYLTPIDDKTVLLGDPALGKSILAAAKRSKQLENEQPAQDDSREQSAEPDPQGRVGPVPADNGELDSLYASASKQLTKKGFKVERIPILLDEYGYTVTYNNVIMEVRRGKRIVYMPVYGLQELDAAAQKKYESLGFKVKPVDVSKIYRFGGTLRCVTNVLARGEKDAPEQEDSDEHSDNLQSERQLQRLP